MLFLHPSRSPPGPGLYILSPRFVSRDREISIHALRVEGDCTVPRLCRPYSAFLSTPSGWRATYEVLCKLAAFLFLSTPSGWRATSYGPCNSATVLHFYPRPPGGGRPDTPNSTTQSLKFLSTPSGWRATAALRRPYTGALISIHALRVEGDRENLLTPKAQIRFLSTPSGWRATLSVYMWQRWCDLFLSTPSGWRATGRRNRRHGTAGHFYPRPPGGGRLWANFI